MADATLCPITFVGFVANNNLNNNDYPPADYTRTVFSTGVTMVTSKNYDALPVTSFAFESQPCMLNSVSVSGAHYMLDRNQYTACPREPITGVFYDPRYYQTGGLAVTELASMTENYVLTTL